MSFSIQERPQPGIWSVTYQGVVNLEDRLMALEAGIEILEKGLARGVIVDFRNADLRFSRSDAYDLAKERISSASLVGVRLAFLFDHEVPAEINFDVLVSQNRALDFATFLNEDEALAWLAKDR